MSKSILLLDVAAGVGGAERVTLPAIGRARPLDVTVAGPNPVIEFARGLGLKVIHLDLLSVRTPLIGALRLIPGVVRIRRLSSGVGASVLYANTSRAAAYALAARRIGAPPIVVHHHEIWPSGRFTAAICSTASAVIVPSEAAAAPFKGRTRLHLVRNGIDLSSFVPSSDKAEGKAAFGLDPQAPVVGYVGRAAPGKGMLEFLEMAKIVAESHPTASFLIAGGATFPEEHAHLLEIERRATGVPGGRVILTGHLDDTSAAYRAMDILVHLGEAETAPTTLIEAAACGVPSLAFAWGGAPELIEDGQTGILVSAGKIGGAASAVLDLLKSPERLVQMAGAARAHAETNFGIDRFSRELTEIVVSI